MKNSKNKMTLCYSAAFFLYLIIYNVVYVNGLDKWSITDITYTFHIVDFSMCAESGFIVGAIYNLLFKKLLPEQMAAYESVLIIALFLFVSVVLAKLICMERYSKKDRLNLTVAALFFISGPCSLSVYTKTLGTLDVYLFYAVALFILFQYDRRLKYLSPLAIVFALCVHMSAVLSVIVVFYFILIYRISDEKEKKERKSNAVILAASLLVTAAAAIYFVVFAKNTVTYDLQGFCNELAQRGAENGHPELVRPSYYTYKLYNNFTNDVWYFGKYYTEYPIEHYFPTLSKHIPESVGAAICGVLNIINLHIRAAYGMRADFYVIVGKAVVIMLPVDIFLAGFWIYSAKRAKNIVQKIMFVFMIFQMPLLFISCSLASLDWGRWIIIGFLTNFTCLLYVIYKEKDALKYVDKVISFFRLRCIIPYLIVYSSVVFYVYVL